MNEKCEPHSQKCEREHQKPTPNCDMEVNLSHQIIFPFHSLLFDVREGEAL